MKILYICTHNRCRSVLSEAITNQKAAGKIVAKSAGSAPAGEVHPLTLRYLQESAYAIEGLSSKSWDELDNFKNAVDTNEVADASTKQTDTFIPDLVVTVCDSANGETCPLWLGDTPKLHWGLTDPSKLAENGQASPQAEQAFKAVIATIEQRVMQLIAIAQLPKHTWVDEINKLANV